MHLPTDSDTLGLVARLLTMRLRPTMFIGKKDIDYLSNYVSGYRTASKELGWMFPQDLLYEEFNKWYIKTHDLSGYVSAMVHLQQQYPHDPVQAIEIYFQAWDQFWELKSTTMSEDEIMIMLHQRPIKATFPSDFQLV